MEAVVASVAVAPHNYGLGERTEDTAVKKEFVLNRKSINNLEIHIKDTHIL